MSKREHEQEKGMRLFSIALRLHRACFPADEARYRGKLATAVIEMQDEKGPPLSAVELARLVDARLRSRYRDKSVDDEKIAAEIEATLDLVEKCQWLLLIRRIEWPQRMKEYAERILEKPLTEKQKRIKGAIERETYPLDFTTGLIRLGIPGKNAAEREARYWEYFKGSYCTSKFIRSGGWGDEQWKDFSPPPEGEIREAYERRRSEGWKTADCLWTTAELFDRWWANNNTRKKAEAGKASGRARRGERGGKK